MNIEQVREYTLSLPGVTEDQAFGEDILNFRLEEKIFVCLWLGGGRYDMKDGVSRIALKLCFRLFCGKYTYNFLKIKKISTKNFSISL